MAHGSSNPTNNVTKLLNTTIDVNAGNASNGTQRVVLATNQSAIPVSQSGTWNIGTVTNLAQLGGTAISMNTGVRDAGTQRVTIATNDSVPVTGTFWQATQPVSAVALPLPTGAATAAKQPALGTAGTASVDVITVQGIAGGVAQPVSGTFWQTTQPISGTVTANAGTGNFTVTQATAANLNATVTGTVELGATSLAALENISVTVPGTVDLGTVSLTALETITVTSGTPNNFQSKVYGAVTTAAPAYTNATDNALSLTTSGALRTTVSEALPAGTNAIGKLAANDGVDIGDVTINNASLAVTGTFYQATQPVSGPLTDTQLRATAVPVSLASVPSHAVTNAGTFAVQVDGAALTALQLLDNAVATDGAAAVTGMFQVGGTDGTNAQILSTNASGHVNIADGGNSITVDGTFWQATQPVSGPLTDTQLRATAVPVSLASLPSLAAGLNAIGSINNTSFIATQATAANLNATVSIAAAQTLSTVTTVSTVTNLAQLGGTAISMNTGVRDAGTQRVTIATNDSVQVKTLPDATATYAPTNATTTAYAASLIAKASAGKLIMITGYNSKTTAQFIQVHNTTTLPADTAVPVLIFTIPPTSNFSLDMGTYGRFFSTGITICNSSTGPTKTIGAADCWFDVQYV